MCRAGGAAGHSRLRQAALGIPGARSGLTCPALPGDTAPCFQLHLCRLQPEQLGCQGFVSLRSDQYAWQQRV